MNFTLYHKEIMNFLHTCIIKFDAFADTYKNVYYDTYGLDLSDPKTNPYYLHMIGKYHPYESPIKIYGENGEQLNLSKEVLHKYPKLQMLYKIPNKQYLSLLEQYPKKVGTIQHIVYGPDMSIDDVINAPDISLLNYDSSLIEVNEYEPIINGLIEYLDVFRERWLIYDYDYDDLYMSAIWSTMISYLPALLFTIRVANIHTYHVHTDHIWSYLNGYGLNNYSSILTKEKSLFLYRNIDYIVQHRGRMSNLKLIAEHLLDDLKISLVQKVLHQDTSALTSTCKTKPEFISHPVIESKDNVDDLFKKESVENIIFRLKSEGYEPNDDSGLIDKVTETLERVPQEETLTKLMELKQNTISTRYTQLLSQFIFESLLLYTREDKLQYRVSLNDGHLKAPQRCSVKELLVLATYALQKSERPDKEPLYIPNEYVFKYAYYPDIDTQKIPKKFYFFAKEYFMDDVFDHHLPYTDINPCPVRFNNDLEFHDHLTQRFAYRMRDFYDEHSGRDVSRYVAWGLIYEEISAHRPESIHIADEETYTEWFSKHPQLFTMVKSYGEELETKKSFAELYSRIVETLLPTTIPYLKEFIGLSSEVDELYLQLKKLFIQLCSYTIVFLDTSRDVETYRYVPDVCMAACIKDIIYINKRDYVENVQVDLIPHVQLPKELSISTYRVANELNVSHPSQIDTHVDVNHDVNNTASHHSPTYCGIGIHSTQRVYTDSSLIYSIPQTTLKGVK